MVIIKQGTVGSLYIYNNPYTHTVDYFILKTSSYGWFPTGQVSNEHWEYVGHDQNSAQALLANRINNKGYLYHGKLLGNINFSNKATRVQPAHWLWTAQRICPVHLLRKTVV